MSSKKVASKDTKAEKKPAAKKTATASAAKKPAVKETASKTASKKPAAKPAAKAPAKAAPKAAAKPATKAAPKAAAKPAAKPAAKAPAKAAPKAAAKPAAKAPAKAAPKAAAKPAPKVAAKPAPKAASKSNEKKAAAPKATANETKAAAKAKTATKPAATEKPKEEPKAVKKGGKVAKPAAEVPAVVEVEKAKPTKKGAKGGSVAVDSVDNGKDSKPEPVKEQPKFDYAILLEGVKKLSKSVMFIEIDEQEDRSNKKKMSSEMKNLEMKPTAAIRHKASLAEETQEELTERILKELEEQNLAFEREAASQMCTRCNRNLVSPEFWVDKHLGYCEECASILKLGQSKEARKVEYQLGGMGDSLDEEDEDIMGPDADDLKEAEEDLAEMGD
ncbi:MAG: hypothetical protein MJY98_03835 [Fibrobacter sp.]|nr:hypothetical protein [Fibrobacter sp.]